MKLRRIFCVMLVLFLCLGMTVSAYAAPQTDTSVYIQNILNYYRCYQSEASQEMEVWLKALEGVDPRQAEAWRKIMTSWQWIDESMDVYYDVLPDNLPQDDSLGIVVMGFALNDDGTMKQELYDRLTVALTSAKAYPNAYIICTGGGTALESDVTEAEAMAQWLKQQGIASQRIIVEDQSMSTVDNAVNTYGLLLAEYPEISGLAVITSDYHIHRSVLFFTAVSEYFSTISGTPVIPVVGNASCWTTYSGRESHNTLASGLAQIAGISLDLRSTPALFAQESENTEAPEDTGSSATHPPVQGKNAEEGFNLKDWFYGLFASILNKAKTQ